MNKYYTRFDRDILFLNLKARLLYRMTTIGSCPIRYTYLYCQISQKYQTSFGFFVSRVILQNVAPRFPFVHTSGFSSLTFFNDNKELEKILVCERSRNPTSFLKISQILFEFFVSQKFRLCKCLITKRTRRKPNVQSYAPP